MGMQEMQNFDNAPEQEIRALRYLLRRVDPSITWDISYHGPASLALIDSEPPPSWNHAIWFAHARMRYGEFVSDTIEVHLPSVLFQFCLSDNAVKKHNIPGHIMLYESFSPMQVAKFIETLLRVPSLHMLRYLQRFLDRPPNEATMSTLSGKVLVLGPNDYLALAPFSRNM